MKCGSSDHDDHMVCNEQPSCFNCKGKHSANAKECPTWKKEKEIISTKHKLGISFPEARKIVESSSAKGKTYADSVKKSLTSTATQTETTSHSTQTESPVSHFCKSCSNKIPPVDTTTNIIKQPISNDTSSATKCLAPGRGQNVSVATGAKALSSSPAEKRSGVEKNHKANVASDSLSPRSPRAKSAEGSKIPANGPGPLKLKRENTSHNQGAPAVLVINKFGSLENMDE